MLKCEIGCNIEFIPILKFEILKDVIHPCIEIYDFGTFKSLKYKNQSNSDSLFILSSPDCTNFCVPKF